MAKSIKDRLADMEVIVHINYGGVLFASILFDGRIYYKLYERIIYDRVLLEDIGGFESLVRYAKPRYGWNIFKDNQTLKDYIKKMQKEKENESKS